MIGKVLGERYEIIREVGRGGMALVYLAHCRILKRNVAVKVLRAEFANDPEFLKRFNTEAQAAAALSHPNIVSVYDFGTQGDIHYIVMEYLEGATLKQYMDEHGMLPWQEAVDFSIQVCRALEHAHRNGVVHRDIKPHNIVITPDHVLKVTDFGIARATTSSSTMTMNNSTMGSVHYFSPEQARGGYTDAKSDLYSLGVMMYEMVAGRLPFDGETPVAIAVMHLQQTPVSPKQYNLDLPQTVEQIILKAMRKEQSQRYQSATEMLADLQAAKENRTLPLFQPVKPAAPEDVPTPPVRRGVVPVRKKKTSEKRALILAIVTSIAVVSLLIAGIVAMVTRGGGKDEIQVPDLIGSNFEDMKKEYDSKNIIIIKVREVASADYAKGDIAEQDPKAGTMVKAGSLKKINVVVSTGAEEMTLPNYENRTVTDAKTALITLGLTVREETETSENIPEGVVIRMSPAAGSRVRAGDTVTLHVSAGASKKTITVPSVIGETLDNAKRILEEAGLKVGTVSEANSTRPKHAIAGQSVSSGTTVPEFTVVDLTVSTGYEDAPTGTDAPSDGKSKSISIAVPQNKDQTNIKVMVDGTTIHEKVHNKSEQAFNLTVRGTGAMTVQVYYDGVLGPTSTVTI